MYPNNNVTLLLPVFPTEANIYQDMTKCRDAIKNKNWSVLKVLVQGIAAKAKRVAEIGKMAADQAKEPRKKERITAAVRRLEKGMLSVVIKYVTYVYYCTPSHSYSSNGVPG